MKKIIITFLILLFSLVSFREVFALPGDRDENINFILQNTNNGEIKSIRKHNTDLGFNYWNGFFNETVYGIIANQKPKTIIYSNWQLVGFERAETYVPEEYYRCLKENYSKNTTSLIEGNCPKEIPRYGEQLIYSDFNKTGKIYFIYDLIIYTTFALLWKTFFYFFFLLAFRFLYIKKNSVWNLKKFYFLILGALILGLISFVLSYIGAEIGNYLFMFFGLFYLPIFLIKFSLFVSGANYFIEYLSDKNIFGVFLKLFLMTGFVVYLFLNFGIDFQGIGYYGTQFIVLIVLVLFIYFLLNKQIINKFIEEKIFLIEDLEGKN